MCRERYCKGGVAIKEDVSDLLVGRWEQGLFNRMFLKNELQILLAMKTIVIESKKYGTKVILVDDEDFENASQYKWHLHKCVHGKVFYARVNDKEINGKQTSTLLHRLIMKQTDPNIKVDHQDHNGLNCQKSNLRICEYGQNARNKRSARGSSSKYVGVYRFLGIKRRENHIPPTYWRAMIGVGGKNKCLGLYKTEEEAAFARDTAAKLYYGEFAHLNLKYA